MKTSYLLKELVIITLLVLPVIYLFAIWNELPDQLPVHWDLNGNANGFGPKWTTSAVVAGIYVLLLLLPLIDPRKENYALFASSWYKLRLIFVLFLSALNVVVMAVATGWDIDIRQFVLLDLMLLVAMLGNYMTTIRPNWFIGIRTPWTMENETVWKKTHKLAGRLWFGGGAAGFIIVLLLPASAINPLLIALLVALVSVPVIYSFVLYKKLKPASK